MVRIESLGEGYTSRISQWKKKSSTMKTAVALKIKAHGPLNKCD